MIDHIKEHIARVEQFSSSDINEIEAFRIAYLGKKGVLNDFLQPSKVFRMKIKKNSGRWSTSSRMPHRTKSML